MLESKEIEMSQHEMFSSYQNNLEYWNNAFLLSTLEKKCMLYILHQVRWLEEAEGKDQLVLHRSKSAPHRQVLHCVS